MSCRPGQRGQAIVETALIIPLVLLLLLGAYDMSLMASAKVEAISGARHGSRIASILGGIPNNPAPPATHTCDGTLASGTTLQSIDKQIVLATAAATANMSNGVVNEIDIYRPSKADGTFNAGPPADPINKYKPDGTPIGSGTFALNQRCQGPAGSNPKDVSVGVQVVWTYTAKNGIGFGGGPITFSNIVDRAVEKMTLCTDNCL
jgi:hypothetical protein